MDKNNESVDSKNSDLLLHPNNNIGLMNHLKKENEKLRKLIISYELKNKKNIYNKKNSKENFNNFQISKFNFKLIKRPKEKKDIIKNNISHSRDNKHNYLNKSIQSAKKFKNITRIKKPEIKKIKDINLFDNDYSYMKKKEDLLSKRLNTHMYNNTLKERNSSISQRNRRILNVSNNNTINSSTMRVKNVIINKSINNYILKPVQNFSSNRSHSKIIKKRKMNDSYFINSTYMKTMEIRKNNNSSLEKNNTLKQNNYKQINTQYIKKNKKKDSTKEIYYQKPIINKINIYNSNNNNSNIRQKIQLSEKVVKKQLITRYNNNNNLPFRI